MAAVTPVKRILNEIARIEGVRGALVVSKDGLVIDAVIPAGGINQEAVAAMVTGVIENAMRFGQEFNLGDLSIVSIEYSNGIAMVEIVGDTYLVVLAESGAVIGRIRYELQKQKERLRAAL